jgi:hypothetical protein
MKKFFPIPLVFGMTVGLSLFSFIPMVQTQDKPTEHRSGQTKVSDKELRAFAKSYVEFHKIRAEYEPALDNAQDPQEKAKIEQEALAKFGKAVQKQGLTVEGYERIFLAVNSDEKLRREAIRLIEEERKQTT